MRLTAADGRELELIDEQRKAIDFAAGGSVEVLYPPGRPYAGRIYTPLSYWLATLVLLGLGLTLTAIGVALLRRAGVAAGAARRRPGLQRPPASSHEAA